MTLRRARSDATLVRAGSRCSVRKGADIKLRSVEPSVVNAFKSCAREVLSTRANDGGQTRTCSVTAPLVFCTCCHAFKLVSAPHRITLINVAADAPLPPVRTFVEKHTAQHSERHTQHAPETVVNTGASAITKEGALEAEAKAVFDTLPTAPPSDTDVNAV